MQLGLLGWGVDVARELLVVEIQYPGVLESRRRSLRKKADCNDGRCFELEMDMFFTLWSNVIITKILLFVL